MELYAEILLNLLSGAQMEITFPGLQPDKLLETACYKALREIRDILRDDTLDDAQCFERIERIVCVFEELGSGGGSRHDFG